MKKNITAISNGYITNLILCLSLLFVTSAYKGFAQLPTVPDGYSIRVHASGGLLANQNLNGIVADPVSGNIYVATFTGASSFFNNFSLYRITPTGSVDPIGNYPFSHLELIKMAWGPTDGLIYTADISTGTIRTINPQSGVSAIYSTSPVYQNSRYALNFDSDNNLIYGREAMFDFHKVTPNGAVLLGQVTANVPNGNHGDAFSIQPNGNYVVYSDCGGQNNYAISTAGHVVGTPFTTLAWTGTSNLLSNSFYGAAACGYSNGCVDPVTGDIYSTVTNFSQGNSMIVFTPSNGGTSSLFVTGAGNGVVPATSYSQSFGITDMVFGKATNGCGYSLFFTDRYQNKVYEVYKTCNQPATITCPVNITVNGDAGVCGATVSYPAATVTGVPGPTVSYSHPSGSFFPVGTTVVTVTASNSSGPDATCTFTVTVKGGVDTDGDEITDVCDPDDDNDNIPDETDCAPLNANHVAANASISYTDVGAVGEQFMAQNTDYTFSGSPGGGSQLRPGGRTLFYNNLNLNFEGLWWTYSRIENPRHNTQSPTGNMVFVGYDPVTGIATWNSSANITWPTTTGSASTATRLRLQLQPHTGSHTGILGSGWINPVTAGSIGLNTLPAAWILNNLKGLGTNKFQVWIIFETSSGVPLNSYFESTNPLGNTGNNIITSTFGTFYSSASSYCQGGLAKVTVSAIGGNEPYNGTGNFYVTAGDYSYTVTDNNGCTDIVTVSVVPPARYTYYRDADGDTYGNPAITKQDCSETPPAGYVNNSNDCDDSKGAVHPGAAEICNDIDDDCDGDIDEDFVNTQVTCPQEGTVIRNVEGCTYTVDGTEFDATVTQNCGPLSYTLSGATEGSGTSLAGVELNAGETVITWSATNAADETISCIFTVSVVPPVPNLTCPDNVTVIAPQGECGTVVNYTAPSAPPACGDVPTTALTFNYTGQIVNWTVPQGVTSITVQAKGAQGGGVNGGLGVIIKGTVNVTSGETIKILVGQQGKALASSNEYGNSGGGGSFVVRNDNTPMIIAGGGGGRSIHGNPGQHGQLTTNGGNISTAFGGINGHGGQGGNLAGQGGCGYPGSGGGGLIGNGGGYGLGGGRSFINGGAGGIDYDENCIVSNTGGFGGGGAGGNGGGGGGGYSGGAGGDNGNMSNYPGGGGGGSYNAGTNQENSGGVSGNTGDGLVTITYGVTEYTVAQVEGLSSGSIFPVGLTTNTFKITDNYGNTSTCSFTVTVKDEQAPTISCPDDITVDAVAGECSVSVPFSASASDNCSATVKYYLNYGNIETQTEITSPHAFAIGTYTVTAVAEDPNNNEAACTFTITVKDVTPPTFSCPQGQAVSMDNSCKIIVPDLITGLQGNDACGAVSFTQTPAAGILLDAVHNGSYQVTVTAKDESNNETSCTVILIAKDVTDPTFMCPQDRTVSLSASCAITIPDLIAGLTGNDYCGTVSFTQSPSAGTVISATHNSTHTVTVTASDGNGNTSSCSVTITAADVIPPVVEEPGGISKGSDAGQCGAAVNIVTPGAYDNCAGVQVTGTRSDEQPLTAQYPVGMTTITWMATDAAGLTDTYEQTITVTDNELPHVITQGITRQLSQTGTVTITADDVDNGSWDNCRIVSMSVYPNSFDCTNVGPNTVTLKVTDEHGNINTAAATVTITELDAQATVTVEPATQQYSDAVTFTATVSPGQVTGSCQAATHVTFRIDDREMGTVELSYDAENNLLTGVLPTTLYEIGNTFSVSPGSKIVTAVFSGINPAFNVPNATTSLEVTHENAEAEYTGSQFVSTPNIAIGTPVTINVPLRMNVQDKADSNPGDVRRAKARFILRETTSNMSIGPIKKDGVTDNDGWISVALINPADSSTGTVALDWSATLSSTSYSETYTIDIEVGGPNGYYKRYDPNDKTVVTVSRPAMDFVTGGGTVMPGTGSGQYAPTVGKKINFGFNLKYNKSGKNLQGSANIVYRRVIDGEIRLFQVKGNAMTSMGVNTSDPLSKSGNFVTKATLTDITDPLDPISYGGNHSLEVKVLDNGEPGNTDQIALTLYKTGGVLLFSSNWTGIKTQEKQINSGNIVVSGGATTAGQQISPESVNVEKNEVVNELSVKVLPNPSTTYFTLLINSNSDLPVNVRVFDAHGRTIEVKQRIAPNSTLHMGDDFRPGSYVVEVIQGGQKKSLKLIKTAD